MELKKPRQFSRSPSRGDYILERILFQILTGPTVLLQLLCLPVCRQIFGAANGPPLLSLVLITPSKFTLLAA